VTSDVRYQVARESVVDSLTVLDWQRVIAPDHLALADARAYCASLPRGFRPPTVNELLTLVEFSVVQTIVPTPPMNAHVRCVR